MKKYPISTRIYKKLSHLEEFVDLKNIIRNTNYFHVEGVKQKDGSLKYVLVPWTPLDVSNGLITTRGAPLLLGILV